jgi:hypothetical protein
MRPVRPMFSLQTCQLAHRSLAAAVGALGSMRATRRRPFGAKTLYAGRTRDSRQIARRTSRRTTTATSVRGHRAVVVFGDREETSVRRTDLVGLRRRVSRHEWPASQKRSDTIRGPAFDSLRSLRPGKVRATYVKKCVPRPAQLKKEPRNRPVAGLALRSTFERSRFLVLRS